MAEGAREQGAASWQAGGEREGGGGQGPWRRGRRGRFAFAVAVSVEGFGGRNQNVGERRADRVRGRPGQGGGDGARVGGGCVFFVVGREKRGGRG